MGQSISSDAPPPSKEEITAQLAEKFARKCFEPLELYCFKDNFKSLADHQQNVRYLKEDTLARFLELPDILAVSPVLFQMLSYIGAFPFLSEAPAVLGLEQMIMVVAIMTERYNKILARGASNRRKLLFKSLAVYDRKMSEIKLPPDETPDLRDPELNHAPGFAVDEAAEDLEDRVDDDDDELVLAALSALDFDDAFKTGDDHSASTHGAMIPADNFRRLLMLLLLVSPIGAQENLSTYTNRVTGDQLESMRSTAEDVLSAFINVEKSPGITFAQFNKVLPANLPFLFDGFNPLFEHFLFSRNFNLSKRKDSVSQPAPHPVALPPLLQDKGNILNLNVLSQLSFFIPGSDLFRRLRLLYSGADAGFSMGSFETKVFNWRAPTILLISGTRLADTGGHGGSEGAFLESLGPKRFPDGGPDDRDRLVFGALIRQPWRNTSKECFGDEGTILFQLSPTHDIFPASSINKNYVAFNKPPQTNAGINFGCPQPKTTAKSAASSTAGVIRHLGPVSMVVDSSFEYAAFTHDYTPRGGAFATTQGRRRYDFQDRMQIDDMEVWGCGGDAEAAAQAERWAWEAKEAEARRRVNLGTGDHDADRQLLEMAGLIGANRSGGSMG